MTPSEAVGRVDLVLHRAHVKVVDGDDVVHVQVVLAPVGLLVKGEGEG